MAILYEKSFFLNVLFKLWKDTRNSDGGKQIRFPLDTPRHIPEKNGQNYLNLFPIFPHRLYRVKEEDGECMLNMHKFYALITQHHSVLVTLM